MPYTFVGRTHSFKGRRLWEIIGHLKNFGVGRVVVRSKYERYPELSFFKIITSEPYFDTGAPLMDEDNIKGKVLVEKIFRGKNFGVVDISKSAYKTDYRLIHKHEEAKYLKAVEEFKSQEVRILPRTREMPPLLKIVAEREGHASTELPVAIATANSRYYRVAEEGEQPTVELEEGLGTPKSPHLYEGVL